MAEVLKEAAKAAVEAAKASVEGTKGSVRDGGLLPPFYRDDYRDITKRAAKLAPEYVFRGVNKNVENQQRKLDQGWEPVEDPEFIKKLRASVLAANGRVRWGDLELWRRRRDVNDAVRAHNQRRAAERSEALRITLQAMAADTAGRTGGAVIPFVTSGTPDHDVLTREKVSIGK